MSLVANEHDLVRTETNFDKSSLFSKYVGRNKVIKYSSPILDMPTLHSINYTDFSRQLDEYIVKTYPRIYSQLYFQCSKMSNQELSKKLNKEITDLTREIELEDLLHKAFDETVSIAKHKCKIRGCELILYKEDGSVKFDEWIYYELDNKNNIKNLWTVDGYDLILDDTSDPDNIQDIFDMLNEEDD